MGARCDHFAEAYRALARGKVTEKKRYAARVLYDVTQEIDFSVDDLDCDKALLKLGLARVTKRGFEIRDGRRWRVWRDAAEQAELEASTDG